MNQHPKMVISVINLKGGVGKTTTAVHLAVSLSRNAKVLLIDLDLQASASLYLGLSRHNLSPSVADWLTQDANFLRVKRDTLFPDLFILPASSTLRNFEHSIAGRAGYLYQLKRHIESIEEHFDYIVIDCPPSFSLLSLNALVASDCFVTPVSVQYMAYEATRDLFYLIKELQQYYRIPLAKCLGVLMTMRKSNKVSLEIEELISKEFGDLLFDAKIEASARIELSAQEKRTIFDWAGKSQIAAQYWGFAQEVQNRLGQHAAKSLGNEEVAVVADQSSWKEDLARIQVNPIMSLHDKPFSIDLQQSLISFPEDSVVIQKKKPLNKWIDTFKRYLRV